MSVSSNLKLIEKIVYFHKKKLNNMERREMNNLTQLSIFNCFRMRCIVLRDFVPCGEPSNNQSIRLVSSHTPTTTLHFPLRINPNKFTQVYFHTYPLKCDMFFPLYRRGNMQVFTNSILYHLNNLLKPSFTRELIHKNHK